MWKALPEKSLAGKDKHCRGGKNAKQRITAAFFVNAAGGKETPILIGGSKGTHHFANLPDISRPCGADYFSHDKVWIKSDIIINVLTKLNKLKRTDRQILLFQGNAPCHPFFYEGYVLKYQN